MKLSRDQYILGVKSIIDALVDVEEGWEGVFGSTVEISCGVPEDAFSATVDNIEKFLRENPGKDIHVQVVETGRGTVMKCGNLVIHPIPHEDVLICKPLAAWIIDIYEEQAAVEAVPHTTDENGIHDSIEETEELNAILDACVLRAHKHQHGINVQESVMYRTCAMRLFRDKENWEGIVAHARAALVTEVA